MIGVDVLRDLRGVDVGVDDLGFRGEGFDATRQAVVEPGADREHDVTVGDGHVRVARAVHPGHLQCEVVVLGEHAHRGHRRHHRNPVLGGELPEFVAGLALEHAAARQNHGLLCTREDAGGGCDCSFLGALWRVVRFGRLSCLRFALGRALRHILREIDEGGSLPALAGERERLAHRVADRIGVTSEVVLLRDGAGHARGIGLLEGVRTDHI